MGILYLPPSKDRRKKIKQKKTTTKKQQLSKEMRVVSVELQRDLEATRSCWQSLVPEFLRNASRNVQSDLCKINAVREAIKIAGEAAETRPLYGSVFAIDDLRRDNQLRRVVSLRTPFHVFFFCGHSVFSLPSLFYLFAVAILSFLYPLSFHRSYYNRAKHVQQTSTLAVGLSWLVWWTKFCIYFFFSFSVPLIPIFCVLDALQQVRRSLPSQQLLNLVSRIDRDHALRWNVHSGSVLIWGLLPLTLTSLVGVPKGRNSPSSSPKQTSGSPAAVVAIPRQASKSEERRSPSPRKSKSSPLPFVAQVDPIAVVFDSVVPIPIKLETNEESKAQSLAAEKLVPVGPSQDPPTSNLSAVVADDTRKPAHHAATIPTVLYYMAQRR